MRKKIVTLSAIIIGVIRMQSTVEQMLDSTPFLNNQNRLELRELSAFRLKTMRRR